MSEINEYIEQASIFTEVSPEEASALLQAKESGILFIGRETCPYCRRFVAKLSEVAKVNQLKVHYLHSQNPKYDANAVQALRDQYGVKTVPGFLYAGTDGVQVKCDSSMSPEEILAFATGK
ncbi:hypothetical protein KBI51_03490 [Aerococcaceae bacterium zg-ZUI334]|uniref:hypothetical protein n=1 Tax=Aerococcaceae bacterium zg-252 TaxID=2796928 RepID=UPI001B98C458|nr:hypothetical protein [Aerococcaceae bacterium zg-ZUI334]MBS4461756.1 hypothetical protein [Aerococcaceae bacterium zg-B36]